MQENNKDFFNRVIFTFGEYTKQSTFSWVKLGEKTALCLRECTLKLTVFGCGREEKEMLDWFHWFRAAFSEMTNLCLYLGGLLEL